MGDYDEEPTCQDIADVLDMFTGSDAQDPLQCYACILPAFVTKTVDRKDWQKPHYDAIRAEGEKLQARQTWLEDTVCEKDELLEWARSNNIDIHCGDLMTICGVKNWETKELHKLKGRIVYRGDSAKDQNNAPAVYAELSANPATIHSINSNIAYGCIPGHCTKTSDAPQAYTQSTLKSKVQTWVSVPKELWPAKWHSEGRRKPMCRLDKSLYGHPESGGHWERHLEEAIFAIGGIAVPNHKSSYWFESSKLLLTVYVDDLMLSGPVGAHDEFWQQLSKGPNPIDLDEPEPLDKFLSRVHAPLE